MSPVAPTEAWLSKAQKLAKQEARQIPKELRQKIYKDAHTNIDGITNMIVDGVRRMTRPNSIDEAVRSVRTHLEQQFITRANREGQNFAEENWRTDYVGNERVPRPRHSVAEVSEGVQGWSPEDEQNAQLEKLLAEYGY